MNTFILNDTEVRLTGRKAVRAAVGRSQELVEVTPVDEDNGNWKKWVPRATLFQVAQVGADGKILNEVIPQPGGRYVPPLP